MCAFALAALSFGQAPPANPGFQKMLKEAKARIKETTTDQLKEWMAAGPKTVLIDVREDKEWEAGRAAGAMHIGRGILDRDIEAAVPDKTARVVLYCAGGGRSALAADTLQTMGYTNVFSLAGGFGAYRKAGMPVEGAAR